MHTIKHQSPMLVNASDKTVIVDTLELGKYDLLLQVTDFGGHDIYEITCPLFLKSSRLAIVAVKLSEYCSDNHADLVTK